MAYASLPETTDNVSLQVAKLREDAADKTREAARLLRLCRKYEEKIAKEEVKRSKYEEEIALYQERGEFYQAKANHSQKLAKNGMVAPDVVSDEIAADRNRAKSRYQKSLALQSKIESLDERLKELKAKIGDYQERREELLREARHLEAEAVRIQREP
jgi:chromosome segregation ATPase